MNSLATAVFPLRERSLRKYLDRGSVSGKIGFLKTAFAVGSLDTAGHDQQSPSLGPFLFGEPYVPSL